MKLSHYLKENHLPVAHFARLIGVKRQTVYSYLHGKKLPSPETMRNIGQVTNAAVLPNDFYDISLHDAPATYNAGEVQAG